MGAVFSPPIQETQIIPEIPPMRRGRPARPVSQQNSPKPSPSPFRGVSNDPFAALDGGKAKIDNSDELSSRFPTLDQFSILHEKGGKFDFEQTVVETKSDADDLSQRIANALADEVFARHSSPPSVAPKEPAGNKQPNSSPERKHQETQTPEPAGQQTPLYQPVPQRPTMVSTGTMTDPPPPPPPSEIKSSSSRPSYRFPPPGQEHRPSSQQWTAESERVSTGQGSVPSQTTPIFKHEPRPKPSSEKISQLPVSSRPSLESSRPSNLDLDDPVTRSKSANSKARPASAFVPSTHIRDPGSSRSSFESSRIQYEDGAPLQHARTDTDRDYDRANIASDIDYLRAKEEEEMNRKREKRMSGGPKHTKRSSLSSLSLSGTKILAGKFGEAFRRFEHGSHHESNNNKSRSPSPDDAHKPLTPITGSEVTDPIDDGRDGNDNDEDDISPETRRELERRRLSQEERRVANAAAEYRRRLAERGEGGRPEIPKAPSIQSKVQSLLQQENNKPPPPKTASGYGRYTDSNVALQAKQFESLSEQQYSASAASRNAGSAYGEEDRPKQLPLRSNNNNTNNKEPSGVPGGLLKQQTTSGTSPSVQRTGQQRPAAPPKPHSLRTGGQPKTAATSGPGRAPSLQGSPTTPTEDWEASFSRRYPSLSGLELVETEIEIPKLSSIRTREV